MQMNLSSQVPAQFVVAKRLLKSDLGWFAEPRFLGRAGDAKQRAIAFNATLVHEILYPGEREAGVLIPVRRLCGLAEDRPRPLSRSGKNWRLGGDKVEGEDLGILDIGDWLLMRFERDATAHLQMVWDVVAAASQPVRHAFLSELLNSSLDGSMVLLGAASPIYLTLCQRAPWLSASWLVWDGSPLGVSLLDLEAHGAVWNDPVVSTQFNLSGTSPESTTPTPLGTESVYFRSRARVLDILGADLIKDEMAGLIELVKNAWDADARRVSLRFEHLDDPSRAGIVVRDEGGSGMTRDVVVRHWLAPATFDKGERELSPRGRALLGRKGVGRFATMRIARFVTLATHAEHSAEACRLEIDWSQFKDAHKELQEVPLRLETLPADPVSEGWTEYRLTGLGDVWNERRLTALVRELRLLVSPPADQLASERLRQQQIEPSGKAAPPHPFEICLDLSESGLSLQHPDQFRSPVEPYSVPNLADYEILAEVEADGSYSIVWIRHLRAQEDPYDAEKLLDGPKLQRYFAGRELDTLYGVAEASALPMDRIDFACGPFQLHISFWDSDRELLTAKGSQLSGDPMNAQDVRRYLNELSGVSIYRDGFRVRPYGDPGQDWLELAQRRVNDARRHLGPNQLRAVVQISTQQNPALEDRSSREGLKENRAFITLRAAVVALLGLVEPLRVAFRERQNLGRPAPKSTQALTLKRKEAFDSLRKVVNTATADDTARETVLRRVKDIEETIEAEHERLDEQLRMMQDVHALGLLARYVVHEGRNVGTAMEGNLKLLKEDAGDMRALGPLFTVKLPLDSIEESIESLQEAEVHLSKLLDDLDPLTRPRKSKRSHVLLDDVIQKALGILQGLLMQNRILLSIRLEGARVQAWEADVLHIVHNILHNSIYWLGNVPGERHIEIRTWNEVRDGKDEVVLEMKDNGPGIAAEHMTAVFELGFSERGGYGMGLFIAQEAVQRCKARMELMTSAPVGACFQVRFERA